MSTESPDSPANLVKRFPEERDDPRAWADSERLLPEVLAAINRAQADDALEADVFVLLTRAADYLGDRDEIERAAELLARSIEMHEAFYGAEAPETADALIELAWTLIAHTDYRAAHRHASRALEILGRSGQEIHRLIAAHSAAGWAALRIGDPRSARDLYAQALTMAEERLPDDKSALATRHSELAEVLSEIGDAGGAAEHLRRALKVIDNDGDPTDERAVATRIALAQTLPQIADQAAGAQRALGRRDEAAVTRQRARELLIEFFESELERDLDVAGLVTLGDACAENRALRIAREAIERAQGKLASSDGGTLERWSVGKAWRALGDEYFTSGRHEEALVAFEAGRVLLEDNPSAYAGVLRGTAYVRFDLGEADAALALHSEAVEHLRASGQRFDLAFGLLAQGGVELYAGNAVKARDLALEALGLLRDDPANRPELIGTALVLAGRADIARDNTARAIEHLEEGRGQLLESETDAESLAGATGWLVAAYGMAGRGIDALRLLDEARGDDNATAVIAAACVESGALEIGQLALERATAEVESGSVGHDLRDQIGSTWHELGGSLASADKPEEAMRAFTAALPLLEAEDHQHRAAVLHDLGRTLVRLGKLDEAAAAFRQRLDLLVELPSRDPYAEGVTLHDLADVLRFRGDAPGARDHYRQAVERKREAGGSQDLSTSLLYLAMMALATSESAMAKSAADEALDLLRDDPPSSHQFVMAATVAAEVALSTGDTAPALSILEEADEVLTAVVADRPGQFAGPKTIVKAFLARAYARAGRADDAARARKQIDTEIVPYLAEEPKASDADFAINVASVVAMAGARVSARKALDRARLLKEEQGGNSADSYIPSVLNVLGRAHDEAGELDEAIEAYRERLELLAARTVPSPADEASTLQRLGNALHTQGGKEDAAEAYRQAVALYREVQDGSLDRIYALGRALMGYAILELHREPRDTATATAALEEALDLLTQAPDTASEDLVQVQRLLAQLRE